MIADIEAELTRYDSSPDGTCVEPAQPAQPALKACEAWAIVWPSGTIRAVERNVNPPRLDQRDIADGWTVRRVRITDAAEPARRELARRQPCGCIVCYCESDTECSGCGAKSCGTHPPGETPNPVYNSAEPAKAPGASEEIARLEMTLESTASSLDDAAGLLEEQRSLADHLSAKVERLKDQVRLLVASEQYLGEALDALPGLCESDEGEDYKAAVRRVTDEMAELRAENVALKAALDKSVCGTCYECGYQAGGDRCETCHSTGHVQPEPVATGTGRVGGGGE